MIFCKALESNYSEQFVALPAVCCTNLCTILSQSSEFHGRSKGVGLLNHLDAFLVFTIVSRTDTIFVYTISQMLNRKS